MLEGSLHVGTGQWKSRAPCWRPCPWRTWHDADLAAAPRWRHECRLKVNRGRVGSAAQSERVDDASQLAGARWWCGC